MKTTSRQQFEIIFYAFLAGVVCLSIGYFIAMSQAAARVRAAAADGVEIVSTHRPAGVVVTIEAKGQAARTFTVETAETRRGATVVKRAFDAQGNEIGGSMLNLLELVVEEYDRGLTTEIDEGDDYESRANEPR